MKDKKIFLLFYLIYIVLFFYAFKFKAYAFEVVFPLPKGNIYITNGYGESDTHQGIHFYSLDLKTYKEKNPCLSYGAPVLGAQAGQIVFIDNQPKGKDKGYGTHVVVKNNNGEKIWYTHLIQNSITVQGPTNENKNIIGDYVQAGQILGLLGDTGNTIGLQCIASGKMNTGAHLHFEMRNKDGKAFKPEPLIGEKSYTNISKAGNPYISTTIMIDPEGYWNKYDGIVPYHLSYNPIKINTFTPLSVYIGSKQTFLMTGENLPDDLSFNSKICENIQWLKKESHEQQFTCDIKEKFSCDGFWFEFSGLYTAHKIIKTPLEDLDRSFKINFLNLLP